MASILLDQLTGPLMKVKPTFESLGRHVKYGQNCNVEFTITDEANSVGYERRGALFTNVLSLVGRYEFDLFTDPSDYSGFNSTMVNAYGNLDDGAVCDTIRKTSRYKAAEPVELAVHLTSDLNENHVSVLFNLLRMWLFKKLDIGKIKVKNDDVFYDDGHVSQTYSDFLGFRFDEDYEIEFNDVLDITNFRPDSGLNENDYCVNLDSFSRRDVNVLAMACAGWTFNSPLKFMSTTPKIIDRLVASSRVSVSPYDVVYDWTAEDVGRVIKKLIITNRVETAFDQAYFWLTTSLFTPIPRAAEANAWVDPVQKFRLPVSGSCRGLVREMTMATPYSRMPSANVTWTNFKTSPERLVVHGIAITEAVYTGVFELMTNKIGRFEDVLPLLGLLDAGGDCPYKFLASCASYRFGREFELRHDTLAGPDLITPILNAENAQPRQVIMTLSGDASDYLFTRTVIGGQERIRIIARNARPVLHPVLSLGINDDRYYLNAYDYSATLFGNASSKRYITASPTDANKVMSILRIGGYDAELFDMANGRRYKNWAANSNGQVMPMVAANPDGVNAYTIPWHTLGRRKHHWINLDPKHGQVTMRVRLSPITYALYTNGVSQRPDVTHYVPVTSVPDIWDQTKSAGFIFRTVPNLGRYSYKDFLISEEQPPQQPVTSELADISKSQSREPLIDQDGEDQRALEEEN